MKIAFIAQPIDPVVPPNQNSIGIIIYEIARRLASRRSVTIYANRNRNPYKIKELNGVKFRFFSTDCDFRFIRLLDYRISKINQLLNLRLSFFSWSLYYLTYILKIAFDLRTQKFDIVHVMNFSQFIPIIRALNPKIKIVIHMHCEWLTQLHRSKIGQRLKKADLVIGCSEFITNKISERFPFAQKKCHTVYNGVDIDLFYPKKRNPNLENSGLMRLLFVGRGSPEKGVHVLFDAFKIITSNYPNVQLKIVGSLSTAPKDYIVSVSDDPKVGALEPFFNGNYRSYLNAKLSSGLSNHVNLVGIVPYAEEVNQYCDADIFIFPSVWNEPFGMPVIEAMACGVPVVSTISGGITELVEDGKTGLLVERGNAEQLADAIMRLLKNEELRESMGKAGRMRVLEIFTWDKVANDLLKLYQSIC